MAEIKEIGELGLVILDSLFPWFVIFAIIVFGVLFLILLISETKIILKQMSNRKGN